MRCAAHSLAALLISPISWSHHWVGVGPALLALAAAGRLHVLFAAAVLLLACQRHSAEATPPFGENELDYPERAVATVMAER